MVFCIGLTTVHSFKQFVLDQQRKKNEGEHHVHLKKPTNQPNQKKYFYACNHISLLILKCTIVEAISVLITSTDVPKLFIFFLHQKSFFHASHLLQR